MNASGVIVGGAPGPLADSGNSNPDGNFRFDPGLGGSGGYIFNLSTTGLTTGCSAKSPDV